MATKLEQSLMDNYLNATYPAMPPEAMPQLSAPAEMKEYDPTVRERLAEVLQTSFEGLGMDRYKARQNAQTLIGGGSSNLPLNIGLADFVPYLGTALQTEEAGRSMVAAKESASAGEYGKAAIEATGGAIGFIPGASSTVGTTKKIIKKVVAGNK